MSGTESLHHEGILLLHGGNATAAELLFRAALRLSPTAGETAYQLGLALARQNKLSEASDQFRLCTELQPDFASAHADLGLALFKMGRHDEAVTAYRTLTRLRPVSAPAHFALGNVLRTAGALQEAVDEYRTAIQLDPAFADCHRNLGLSLASLGDLNAAEASFCTALRLSPEFAAVHNDLGLVLLDLDRPGEAAAAFREAVRLDPESPEPVSNLGVALTALGLLEEAIVCHERAVEMAPASPGVHNNYGIALRAAGNADAAVDEFRKAQRLDPNNAGVLNNLGEDRLKRGDFPTALDYFKRALRADPSAPEPHLNQAVIWLTSGDFRRGWPEFEWRWKQKGITPRRFAQPRWDGTPLAGKTILLRDEQGLGDTIQFVRYASVVKRQGCRVVLECVPLLLPLLSGCPGIDLLVPSGSPLPPFDVEAPLLSLPAIIGTTLDTVPAHIPYLSADPDRIRRWQVLTELVPGFRIGIAWQGNKHYAADRDRSIPLRSFRHLAVEGVRLVSLQIGPVGKQLASLAEPFPVHQIGAGWDEDGAFLDTAAILSHLDLVVSADTAVAHLAGALGVPVWLALARTADWRWLRDRPASPWYPSTRLFRQELPGDWESLFHKMAARLHEVLRARKPRDADA